MTLTEELLRFRNKVHKDDFRLNLSPDLWSSHYLTLNEIEEDNLIQLRSNSVLKGYAALAYMSIKQNKALVVREMCADTEETFQQLIDRVIDKGVRRNVDFIVWRKCQETFDDVLEKRGFLTFSESIIMVALLNTKEFLKPFSEDVECGKVARLIIKGLEPVFIRIGKDKFSIIENGREDFTIFINGLTFIKLFFGKSSFFKEWLKRKVKVSISHYLAAKHLFEMLKNERWYIPSGDWC